MKYRKLPKGSEEISIIGLGGSGIHEADAKTRVAILKDAFANGINYFDLALSEDTALPAYREAFKDVRDQVYYQIHFGADYSRHKYGWTTNLKLINQNIKRILDTLETDYIDFGFIHCLDEEGDVEEYIHNGVLAEIKSLKEKGIVRHIGLSTHNPKIALKLMDEIDMLMFSINPAFDRQAGDYAIGSLDERRAMYLTAEKAQVGISVMKPFAGGQLLKDETSPFKKALSKEACLQYALDQPGVITVLPGVRSLDDLHELLAFLDCPEDKKDYSSLAQLSLQMPASCVYCHHCEPCPMGLDIALINQYYDLAVLAHDELAKDHYLHLDKQAKDCAQCGHCNQRCPFQIDQMARMKEIANYFENA